MIQTEQTDVVFVLALDPSGKYFEVAHPDARLDSSDAQFVDVIHTDSEDNGLEQPLGHIDFYPNGGEEQKGCGVLDGRNSGVFSLSKGERGEIQWDVFHAFWRILSLPFEVLCV